MKTKPCLSFWLTLLLGVASFLTVPAEGQPSTVVGQITGGSNGTFVATHHSLNVTGYTDFAVALKLYSDGTVAGEFTCAIPNVVVLAVIPTNWSTKPDGSIQITGNEYGYDAVGGAGYSDCPAIVVFHAGGIGVGGFDFSDCVFGEGQYDTEAIRFGSIDITLY